MITEKQIIGSLVNIIDPEAGKPVTDFIPRVVIRDNSVFFTLEYSALKTTEQIKAKEHLRDLCEGEVKKIKGVGEVKITVSSTKEDPKVSKKSPIMGVKKIILVASGKGGVGKSTVACNLAVALSKSGKRTALVDADIYGPSMPKMFGIAEKPELINNLMIPLEKFGIKLMSMGFLVNPDAAAVWRGPMVTKALFQLMRMTNWAFDDREVDVMVIDTPPGTGDVHLSLAENYIIDGVVLVSTPQEVALADVRKAYDMFNKLHIPVLGVVENMSYFEDEKSKNITYIFGRNGVKNFARKAGINFLGEIPLNPKIASSSDHGTPIVLSEENGGTASLFREITKRVC
ncbi:Mrp/NBP35 family ATP-binding protein [Holosporaceae bacterium 'Namur']|nr:Mrp/NBP35 family ATP-binding protein [Holosporaceae bacterium 'Namur']